MKNSVGKKFAKYVSLSVLSMLALSCYILADTFFVSWGLGSDGIAALNFAISFYSIINACGLMLGIGGGAKYSSCKAAGKDKEAEKIFSHALFFGLALGIVIMLIGIFFVVPLSMALGAREQTLTLTIEYLRTIMCFSPLFILNNIVIGFVRNDGAPNVAMRGMVIGSLSNVILDYVFVIVLKMGMFGAAFATGLAPAISLLVMLSFFVKKRNSFRVKKCKIEIKQILGICHTGATSFVIEVAFGIVLIIFNLNILSLTGTLGVAAYGIVANVALVITSLFTGIAQGLQPILSSEYGKNNRNDLKQTLKLGIITAICLFIVIYLLTNLFSAQIISIFNKENSAIVVEIANQGFMLYFAGFLFAGLNIVLSHYFSATLSASKGFLVALLQGSLFIIPLVLIFSALFGMTGIWLSYVTTQFLTLVVTIILLNSKSEKKKFTHCQ